MTPKQAVSAVKKGQGKAAAQTKEESEEEEEESEEEEGSSSEEEEEEKKVGEEGEGSGGNRRGWAQCYLHIEERAGRAFQDARSLCDTQMSCRHALVVD